jgi:hypothetical protein
VAPQLPGELRELGQEAGGERRPGRRGPALQLTVQLVRDVADLDRAHRAESSRGAAVARDGAGGASDLSAGARRRTRSGALDPRAFGAACEDLAYAR